MSKLLKAELHAHLEGTMRPEIAYMLAERNHLNFPKHILGPSQQFYLSDDFLHFLKVYDLIAELIRQPKDYYDITYDYLKQSANQGVIYSEMMYSPEHAEKVSGIPSKEHLFAINDAIKDARVDFQIEGRILISGVRHFGSESCEHVAREATKVDLPCVIGFCLGGDEIHYPPEWFAKAFAIAHDGGLPCTMHAGEFGSAQSIITAIETCKVTRIGHGVAAIQSPEVMAFLKDKNIALEICPSSNVQFGLFPSLSQHPIIKFLEAGIDISINSDDPPFMNTTIEKEYLVVEETFQLSHQQMLAITKMALERAFVDQTTKQSLLNRLKNH
jgi:adenosine deaminase